MLSRLSSALERKLSTGGTRPATDPSTQLTSLASADEAALRALGVSLCAHTQACADCAAPPACGHELGNEPPEYLDAGLLRTWARQDIDLTPEALLTLAPPKPFAAHALISTEGREDWVREVSEARGSLAELFARLQAEDEREDGKAGGGGGGDADAVRVRGHSLPVPLPQGVWSTASHRAPTTASSAPTSTPTRVLFQNSSHYSTSSHRANAAGTPHHTLLLFPAYQLITNVPAPVPAKRAGEGNERVIRAIWDAALRDQPRVGVPAGRAEEDRALLRTQGVQRWVLPYRAVVLLCSHKKRDARCSIAAALLASALRHHAEEAGWTVDERGDASSVIGHDVRTADDAADDDDASGPQPWGLLDESSSNTQAQAERWRRLASLGRGPDDDDAGGDGEDDTGTGTLGIFRISHIGGHKYSGNMIVYFPTGAGVWYGRVSPQRDAKLVFEKTIQQGIVIPEFLRAGINLVRSPPPAPPATADAEAHTGGSLGNDPTTAAPAAPSLVSGTREDLVESGVLPRGSLVRW